MIVDINKDDKDGVDKALEAIGYVVLTVLCLWAIWWCIKLPFLFIWWLFKSVWDVFMGVMT